MESRDDEFNPQYIHIIHISYILVHLGQGFRKPLITCYSTFTIIIIVLSIIINEKMYTSKKVSTHIEIILFNYSNYLLYSNLFPYKVFKLLFKKLVL